MAENNAQALSAEAISNVQAQDINKLLHINTNSLPKFDGGGSVRSFIREVTLLIEGRTDNDRCRYVALYECLKGDAWFSFTRDHKNIGSYDKLLAWLKTNYDRPMKRFKGHTKIAALQQNDSETIRQFRDRIYNIWTDVHGDDWPKDDVNAQAVIMSMLISNCTAKLKMLIPADIDANTAEDLIAQLEYKDEESRRQPQPLMPQPLPVVNTPPAHNVDTRNPPPSVYYSAHPEPRYNPYTRNNSNNSRHTNRNNYHHKNNRDRKVNFQKTPDSKTRR